MIKLEKYGSGLREALARQLRFSPVEQREAMAVAIEGDLPPMLADCFGVEVEQIYDLISASEVRELRNRMVTMPEAKARDDEQNGRLSLALKLYADFLDSKFNPAKRKPKALKSSVSKPGGSEELRQPLVEGAIVQSTIDRRERNPQARRECIELKGCKCIVCGFDFEAVYGTVGRNYIEVHHLKPISQTDDEHLITSADLVPLCANCHAMAHRRSPEPYTPDELKAFINSADN